METITQVPTEAQKAWNALTPEEQAEQIAKAQEARDEFALNRQDAPKVQKQTNPEGMTQEIEDSRPSAVAKIKESEAFHKAEAADNDYLQVEIQDTFMLFPVREKFSDKSPDYEVHKPMAVGKGFIKVGIGWIKEGKQGKQFIIIKTKRIPTV